MNVLVSGVATSLVLAGHLLYASLLASPSCTLRTRLRDMSRMNMMLWLGTCLARPSLRYATDANDDIFMALHCTADSVQLEKCSVVIRHLPCYEGEVWAVGTRLIRFYAFL